jgi:hypothetical protein
MKKALRFSQLSPSRQVLVRLCQDVNFGSIHDVKIVNGEVSFDPQPQILVDVRLDKEAATRREGELNDFNLRGEWRRLLDEIDALRDGTIEEIVVHGGVPRRVLLRRRLSVSCP